jgi:hypothetical protein
MTAKDDDGQTVRAGDKIYFEFGIPPLRVIADVVDIVGRLFVLTPGLQPDSTNLRTLRRYVGGWWKYETND